MSAARDAVLLGGDIAEAPDVRQHLERLDARLGLPIHFVLGNHDFYGGSIARVRAEIATLCDRIPRLCWLSQAGVVELTPATGLVGHEDVAGVGGTRWCGVDHGAWWQQCQSHQQT